MRDFILMRRLIGVELGILIWVAGATLLTAGVLVSLVGLEPQNFGGTFATWLLAVLTIIFGNLAWRLVCETLVVLFQIHRRLEGIAERLRRTMK